MAEAPMPVSLAAYIKDSIDRDEGKDFDLDIDQIIRGFPDMTEADFELALTTVAAELRGDGLRLIRQAEALDGTKHEWVERLRSRA
jgi:hypothetical protein